MVMEGVEDDNVYTELQRSIQQDLDRRSAENQSRVREIQEQRINFAGGPTPLILVADGDSWFDYPLPALASTDVARSLQAQGVPEPAMMRLAHYGDATTVLLGVTKRQRLIDYIKDPAHGPIDAILFSGGGNDLVGDQFRFWLNSASSVAGIPADGVNLPLLNDVLGVVLGAYEELIRVRDAYAHNAYLLVHAYDFAIPTGTRACPSVGPWLRPSLVEQGWDKVEDGSAIVKQILEAFAARLIKLSQNRKVVFVKTQGVLAADEWANELHPTPHGFDKIAAQFRLALQGIPEFRGKI